MKDESRWLYIAIIIILIMTGFFGGILHRKLGVSEGKLQVLEEFRNIYMPAEPEFPGKEEG